LTQRQLAEKLSVNVRTVKRWEANFCEPHQKTLFKIANILEEFPSENEMAQRLRGMVFFLLNPSPPVNVKYSTLCSIIGKDIKLKQQIIDGMVNKCPDLKNLPENLPFERLFAEYCRKRPSPQRRIFATKAVSNVPKAFKRIEQEKLLSRKTTQQLKIINRKGKSNSQRNLRRSSHKKSTPGIRSQSSKEGGDEDSSDDGNGNIALKRFKKSSPGKA